VLCKIAHKFWYRSSISNLIILRIRMLPLQFSSLAVTYLTPSLQLFETWLEATVYDFLYCQLERHMNLYRILSNKSFSQSFNMERIGNEPCKIQRIKCADTYICTHIHIFIYINKLLNIPYYQTVPIVT